MFRLIIQQKAQLIVKRLIQMSTTFKIIQKHIESSKLSPKKSIALASSQNLSPRSRVNDSGHDSQSYDEQEILKLQIKQLKRENTFLKKKIAELTEQLNGNLQQPKKKIISGKGIQKQDIDPTHMTVDFFFKQINNLMNSLADLFRVQFTNDEVKQYSSKFSTNDNNIASNQKYVIYKKFILSRKLQKITLESEQKKYPLLLDIFTTYYKAKQECDRFVREMIDKLSARVLQMNKMIFQYVSKKKNNLKSSCVKSQSNFEDTNQKNNTLTIPLPWTFKSRNPSQKLNFSDQNNKKKCEQSIIRYI